MRFDTDWPNSLSDKVIRHHKGSYAEHAGMTVDAYLQHINSNAPPATPPSPYAQYAGSIDPSTGVAYPEADGTFNVSQIGGIISYLPNGNYLMLSGITSSGLPQTKEVSPPDIPAGPSAPLGPGPFGGAADPNFLDTNVPGTYINPNTGLPFTPEKEPDFLSPEVPAGFIAIRDVNGNIIDYRQDPTFQNPVSGDFIPITGQTGQFVNPNTGGVVDFTDPNLVESSVPGIFINTVTGAMYDKNKADEEKRQNDLTFQGLDFASKEEVRQFDAEMAFNRDQLKQTAENIQKQIDAADARAARQLEAQLRQVEMQIASNERIAAQDSATRLKIANQQTALGVRGQNISREGQLIQGRASQLQAAGQTDPIRGAITLLGGGGGTTPFEQAAGKFNSLLNNIQADLPSSIGSGPAPIPITSSAAQGKIGSAANENILVHAGEVVKVRDGRMAEIVPADRAGTIPVTRSAAGGVTFTDRPFVSNVLPGEGFNEQSVKFSPDASATIGTPSVPVTSPPETTAPTATPGTVDTTPDIAGTIEFVLSSLQSDGLLNRDRLIQNLSRLQRLGNNPASFNIQKAIARLGANDLQGAIGELAGAATLFGAAQEQPKQGSIPIASPKPLSDPTGAKNVPLPTMTPAQRRRMLELGIDPRDPDALDQLKAKENQLTASANAPRNQSANEQAAAANPDIVPVGQFDFSSNPDLQDLYDQYQAVLTGGAFAGGFTAKKKLLESMTAALGQEFADSIGWDGDRFSVADAFRNLNGYFSQFKQTQESFDAAVKTAQSGDAGGGDANGGADGGQDTDGTGATDEPTAEEAFLANQGFDPTDQEAFDTMKQLLEDILAGKTRTDNPLPEETLFGVNLGSPSLIAPTLNKLDSASQGILLSAMAFRLGITVDQLLREFVYPNTPNAVPITSSFVRAA